MNEEVSVIVSQREPFIDDRGRIGFMAEGSFGSALVITSTKGAVRANHYHRTDDHYCYLLSGAMLYYQRKVGDTSPPDEHEITSGQVFYTPPMYEHAMRFTEDSVLFVCARNNRQMPEYEADTVRVTLI